MTLLERTPETPERRSIPVLETERLILRAPRSGTPKRSPRSSTTAASPRTRRAFPHPYGARRRGGFHRAATAPGGETAFMITLARRRAASACCGIDCERRPAARDRLLARRAVLGQGLRHRSGARASSTTPSPNSSTTALQRAPA